MRLILHVFVLLMLLMLLMIAVESRAHAQDLWTPDDTEAAITQFSQEFGVSYDWLRATVRCESSGDFGNYHVGRQGELGAAQLHPRGLLPAFYAEGYTDPHDPYQSIRFMTMRFAAGQSSAWSCAR